MRMIPVAHFGLGLALVLGVSGCANLPLPQRLTNPLARPAPAAAPDTAPDIAPDAGPKITVTPAQTAALRPPAAGARSVQGFDTTSPAQRAAAVAAAANAPAAVRAGLTTVSLGDPAAPGLWLETPLIRVATSARVTVPATGQAAVLDLRPIPGATGAGSRMSLAAMRLLGLPLTALTEVAVDLP